MAKIKLRASSLHSIRFNVAETVTVDPDEWADMDADERTRYVEEEIRRFREDVVDIDAEVEED
jgi:hypothetical protein